MPKAGADYVANKVVNNSSFVCREFAAVSARLETVVKERTDKVTGKDRAATSDDYADVSFALAPRHGAEGAAIWAPDANIVVSGRRNFE